MKKSRVFITIITILIALFVINFIAARHPGRIDLTQNNIYTLSKATEDVLGSLDDVVTIRIYFTADLPPSLQILRQSVEDVISEFKGIAGRNIQVEFIDPNASPMEEQKVAMLGIPPLQLNVIEHDKQEVAKIYLGMAVLYGENQQIIPVVKRPENLEYDLTEAIIKVSSESLPALAWWSIGRNEEDPGMDTYFIVKEALSRRYALDEITTENISELKPEKYAALIMTSSNAIIDDELRALDSYLMNGGNVMALLDRYAITPSMTATLIRSNVFDIFASYGASVLEGLVLDQSNAMASFSGGPVTYHLPYSLWPDIRNAEMNGTEPIVSDLETIVLPWTSPIEISKVGGGSFDDEILATSSHYSAVEDGESIPIDPQGANESLIALEKKKSTMIALLRGPFGSYFAEKAADTSRKIESPETARIFIVGSARWVSDRFLQNFPANAALFENAIDSFAMGDLLIGIRSKESTSRPIEILSDGTKTAIKYINLAFGPIAVAIIGFLIFAFRRSKKNAIKMQYGGTK